MKKIKITISEKVKKQIQEKKYLKELFKQREEIEIKIEEIDIFAIDDYEENRQK